MAIEVWWSCFEVCWSSSWQKWQNNTPYTIVNSYLTTENGPLMALFVTRIHSWWRKMLFAVFIRHNLISKLILISWNFMRLLFMSRCSPTLTKQQQLWAFYMRHLTPKRGWSGSHGRPALYAGDWGIGTIFWPGWARIRAHFCQRTRHYVAYNTCVGSGVKCTSWRRISHSVVLLRKHSNESMWNMW